MRVGGHGGCCRVGDAPVAPAPVCAEHAPGPCPLWLPRFCPDHGHGPCAPPPPAPDVVGPSNWAGPAAMEIEPALSAPTPSFTVAGLRRHQSRSPLTIAARQYAPARRIITDTELAAPRPPPQLAEASRHHVHAGQAANRHLGLRRTWICVPHGDSARSLPNGHAGPSGNGGTRSSSDEDGGLASPPS